MRQVILDLQHLLEKPLQGPDGEAWKAETRQKSEDYLAWEDAQINSTNILEVLKSMKDNFYPLEKMKRAPLLQKLWERIDLVRLNILDSSKL